MMACTPTFGGRACPILMLQHPTDPRTGPPTLDPPARRGGGGGGGDRILPEYRINAAAGLVLQRSTRTAVHQKHVP